jgi:hypothetical protein
MGVRTRIAVAAALGISLPGCPFGGVTRDLCAQDSLRCGEGPAFVLDEDCDRDDPLAATLGQGDRDFVVLLPGDDPDAVSGLEGKRYVVLALQVENPDPDHLMFEVEIDLEHLEGEYWEDVAQRKAVYGESVAKEVGGAARILGIVIAVDDWFEDENRRISIDIRDSCNRRTDVIHRFFPEQDTGSSSGNPGD